MAAVASGSLVAVLMLPILPPATLAQTPIGDINSTTVEQIGWPEFVDTVQGVVDELPAADRERAAVLTANYGEAAALELLGGSGMPPVYSGHNSYWSWGPPPDERNLVILVGWWDPGAYYAYLGPCDHAATITNAAGAENEELGAGVWVCAHPPSTWSAEWDQVRHLDGDTAWSSASCWSANGRSSARRGPGAASAWRSSSGSRTWSGRWPTHSRSSK